MRRTRLHCARCQQPIRPWQRRTHLLSYSDSGPGTTLHLHQRCIPATMPCAPCLKARIFGLPEHTCHRWTPTSPEIHQGRMRLRLRLRDRPQPCPCPCRTQNPARRGTNR
ncbi:hypothetical protein ACFV0R_07340 [Streptomyces sp. NPDC059578]|uniref:hypothetical protein n=1 Tax=unclassified Streptomyces TaxID=2593676 RepID=UPI003658F1B0